MQQQKLENWLRSIISAKFQFYRNTLVRVIVNYNNNVNDRSTNNSSSNNNTSNYNKNNNNNDNN